MWRFGGTVMAFMVALVLWAGSADDVEARRKVRRTPTATPTATFTPTSTFTPTATNTPTNTPVGPTNTPTNTPLPTSTPTPTNTPTNTPTPTTNIMVKGLNATLSNNHTQNYLMYQKANAIGAKTIRSTLAWRDFEGPTNDVWSSAFLTDIDRMVNEMETFGIKPIFGFARPPCQESADPSKSCSSFGNGTYNQWYRPASATEYGKALAVLMNRYGDRVLAWEIWNEPNNPAFWGGSSQYDTLAAAQQYVPLVQAARQQGPAGAKILGGALSNSGTGEATWLGYLYDNGIQNWMTALSVHPYTWLDPNPGATPEDCSFLPMALECYDGGGNPTSGLPLLRKVMVDRGDSAKKMWVTEAGWPCCWTNGWFDEAKQADYLTREVAIIKKFNYIPVYMWYTTIDLRYFTPTYPLTDRECCYGLYRSDTNPKTAATNFNNIVTLGGWP